MALKLGPINGHTVMLDAQSDPDAIWILCSCGENLNVNEPPTGSSLKKSILRVSEHLGMELPSDEELEKRMEAFDQIFPLEERKEN